MVASLLRIQKISLKVILASGVTLVVLSMSAWLGVSLVEGAKLSSLEADLVREATGTTRAAVNQEDFIAVDRDFVDTMPADWRSIRSIKEVKDRFVAMLLPHVLHANENVMGERVKLLQIRKVVDDGERLTPADTTWLLALAGRYHMKDIDLDELVLRVDVIPPSLALTQAAIESGWGRSRFAMEGQALYGQWTTIPGTGIVPANRPEDASYEVRRFDSLGQSVQSYMRNLNSHAAYRRLRTARAEMRAEGQIPDGRSLSVHLYNYSSRGPDYVADVQQIMRTNDLYRFDRARLASF